MSMLKKPAILAARVSVLLALTLAAGCVEKPSVAASGVKLYAVDFAGAAAKCTAPADVKLTPGHETEVAMSVSNEGGWCAFKVDQSDAKLGGPKPFAASLVTVRAAHGKVYIHTVGEDTRVDYTPDARYAGPDAFTVEMLPGDLSIHTNVTVGPA